MSENTGSEVFSPRITNQSIVRRFVSQGGRGYLSIDIQGADGSVEPDTDSLHLGVWYRDVSGATPVDPRGDQVLDLTTADIHRADTGLYDVEIGPENTGNRGVLTAEWTYQIDGKDYSYTDNLQILNRMPTYDTLTDAEKLVVTQVSWMFGDLFDSTEGGPYLVEPFQSHFDYERIAQLMSVAVTRVNTTGYPVTHWGVGGDGQAVPANFSGVIVLATYYEVIRHLVRSYTEIAAKVGLNITYLDRRDYMQRWQSILSSEWPEFTGMVKLAKRELLNLGRGALLVAGGYFGGSVRGPFIPGGQAMTARSFKFYPAASAIGWSSRI